MAKSGSPWTRAARKYVHGSRAPNPFDAPLPGVSEAWATVRSAFVKHAPAQRAYKGDPEWVARCHEVEAELASEAPPASIEVRVEQARTFVLSCGLRHMGPKGSPELIEAALGVLRAKLGGPAFVVDYLCLAELLAGGSHHSTGYELDLHTKGAHSATAVSDSERHALRRAMFEADERAHATAVARLGDVLTERSTDAYVWWWANLRDAMFVLGRDHSLAHTWVERGLRDPPPPEARRQTTFARSCLHPHMLACVSDGDLALRLVEACDADWQYADAFIDSAADYVESVGRSAIPVLERITRVRSRAPGLKVMNQLLDVARAM